MPKDRPTFWLVVSALVVGGLLAFMSFVGILSTRSSAEGARRNTQSANEVLDALRYNADRGDCIRDVQADADQEFRREISALFDAGRDPVKIDAVRDRMRAQPNYADTVKKVCPPPLSDR